jgi:hypothetical protein
MAKTPEIIAIKLAIRLTMGCTLAILINADVPLTIVNKSD